MWAAWTWTIRSQALEKGDLHETQCKYFCFGFGAVEFVLVSVVPAVVFVVELLVLECEIFAHFESWCWELLNGKVASSGKKSYEIWATRRDMLSGNG